MYVYILVRPRKCVCVSGIAAGRVSEQLAIDTQIRANRTRERDIFFLPSHPPFPPRCCFRYAGIYPALFFFLFRFAVIFVSAAEISSRFPIQPEVFLN